MSNKQDHLIDLIGISKEYDGTTVLKDINGCVRSHPLQAEPFRH